MQQLWKKLKKKPKKIIRGRYYAFFSVKIGCTEHTSCLTRPDKHTHCIHTRHTWLLLSTTSGGMAHFKDPLCAFCASGCLSVHTSLLPWRGITTIILWRVFEGPDNEKVHTVHCTVLPWTWNVHCHLGLISNIIFLWSVSWLSGNSYHRSDLRPTKGTLKASWVHGSETGKYVSCWFM